MYSYKERMKAVKEYIASGYRANRTVAKLGYPSHQALKNWYDETEIYTEILSESPDILMNKRKRQ